MNAEEGDEYVYLYAGVVGHGEGMKTARLWSDGEERGRELDGAETVSGAACRERFPSVTYAWHSKHASSKPISTRLALSALPSYPRQRLTTPLPLFRSATTIHSTTPSTNKVGFRHIHSYTLHKALNIVAMLPLPDVRVSKSPATSRLHSGPR